MFHLMKTTKDLADKFKAHKPINAEIGKFATLSFLQRYFFDNFI